MPRLPVIWRKALPEHFLSGFIAVFIQVWKVERDPVTSTLLVLLRVFKTTFLSSAFRQNTQNLESMSTRKGLRTESWQEMTSTGWRQCHIAGLDCVKPRSRARGRPFIVWLASRSARWLTWSACRVCEVASLPSDPSFRCHLSCYHTTADAQPSPAQRGVRSGSVAVHNLTNDRINKSHRSSIAC